MADLASLYIKVDSKGVVTASKELNKLTADSKKTETATKSVTKSFSKLQAVVVALASSYALLKIAQYIKDTALLAARYETLGVVMHVVGKNAGYTAAQMDKFALGLQKTGIAMVESRNTLARMIQAQIDLINSQKLARIAQNAAVIGAMNSSEAFEHMIYGLQTGHPRILRAIGLNVDFDKSVRALADSLGIEKDALSEAQIMQGRVNAVVKAGVLITGTYEAAMTTAGKKIASFTRYVENFKVKMGKAFGPATVTLIDAATKAMKQLQEEIVKPEVQNALKVISSELADIVVNLGQKLPSYIETITKKLETLWKIASYDPAIIEYGIVGLLLGGKKGAVLAGSLAHMVSWLSNLSTALGLVSVGVLDISQVATANFKELQELVDNFDFPDPLKAMQLQARQLKERIIELKQVTEGRIFTFRGDKEELVKLQDELIAVQLRIEAMKKVQKEMAQVPKPPETDKTSVPVAVKGLTEEQIKDMQAQEAFAIKMSEAEQKRLNERYELEQEINAKIHDELLSDTEFRIQELDKQFLAADGFVKDKAMLDEWYVKKYEEIVGTQEQAYMDLYNNLGILTQEAYNQIYETYVKDRDDFIALTGDKETAHQVFTERLNALNEEMETGNKSWIDGAKAGLESYAESSNDAFTNIKELAVSSLKGIEDTLVDFCMTGKLNFKQLAASILKDLIRIAIQAAITNAIMAGFSLFSPGATPTPMGGTAAGSVTGMTPTTPMMAKGGIFRSGLSSHSNSIVDSPTFFSFARGQGLMGEAGPEAIMPLTRLPSGDLGVKTEPGKADIPAMIVNIHEAPGTQTRVEQSEDGQSLEVIIEQVEQSMQSRMSRGTGMAPFMDGRYGRAY